MSYKLIGLNLDSLFAFLSQLLETCFLTVQFLSGSNQHGVLSWVVWSFFRRHLHDCWQDSVFVILKVDNHASDSLSQTLRDQNDSNIIPVNQLCKVFFELRVSCLLRNYDVVTRLIVLASLAKACEKESSDGCLISHHSDEQTCLGKLKGRHVFIIIIMIYKKWN